MPLTATSAKGVANIVLEANNGMQLLLAQTAIIATITGITAPSGSTGMRLYIKLENFTTSGSITITGTGTPNNTETYTVAALTAQQTQSGKLADYEVVSVNAYTAITNITTTGLTGGIIVVYGIQAGKYALPSVLKSKRTPKIYSPNEHNGYIGRDKKIAQLVQNTTIDEIKQDAYGDLSWWWPYVMMGAPVSTATIPASPTSLFAATAISSTQSLTTQPTAPGMRLILTITSFTIAGTLTITGTVNGVANVSETISITAAGTYYSSNIYQSVNASGITNATTAATMAITGVFGWVLTFNSEQALYSAAVEWFDGVGSWTHPFSIFEEGTFDSKVETEITLTAKGKAQDKLPIGDRTTSVLAGLNRIASLGQNLNDIPMVGWQSKVYLDPITGTPLTTYYGDPQEIKIDLKTPQEDHFTFTNTQVFNRAYPAKRECMVTMSIDFTNMAQYEQFRQNLKQYLVYQTYGQFLGNVSGTPYFKSWTWTLPIRSDGGFDVTSDPTKGIVTASTTWRTEIDPGIGALYQLVVTTSLPPTFTI
jgi:hypothetical protein